MQTRIFIHITKYKQRLSYLFGRICSNKSAVSLSEYWQVGAWCNETFSNVSFQLAHWEECGTSADAGTAPAGHRPSPAPRRSPRSLRSRLVRRIVCSSM